MNVVEIEERIEQLAKDGFKPADFIFDFIAAYDAPKAILKQLRQGQQNSSEVGGVLWRRYMHYKSAKRGSVGATIEQLQNAKENAKHKVRYLISTDGDQFAARDLKSGETLNCDFGKLGDHFGFFLPLANIERYKIADENPVDIKATGRLAKFYDSILEDNPAWRAEENRHTLNHFMTQIVFCLFAEDTGIFPSGIFSETLKTYCETDTAQTQSVLTNVFTAMSLPDTDRNELPSYARKFPYVNGGLFGDKIEVPRFLRGSVRYLLDAAMLDWRQINPDIFGSMIQSIVNDDLRGELGMHYTSVPNILKVLDPLFLDELRNQFSATCNSPKGLQDLLLRLSRIRVFDPACGSGNFLVVAYRELREFEIEIINQLKRISQFQPQLISHIQLSAFYGIEYIDFAAETARLSLWIADYQMNSRYQKEYGWHAPSLPLKDHSNIVHGNALRIAWSSVCNPDQSSHIEIYIVGNPPYYGRQKRTEDQQLDMEMVFSPVTEKFANLDYVSAWFLKASEFITQCPHISRAGLVATNSITQGEQVSLLWSALAQFDTQIHFAHTSFKWSNLAGNIAGVTCVIIGLGRKTKAPKYLYTGTTRKQVSLIGPYLAADSEIIVQPQPKPISRLHPMDYGSMSNDGGCLIISPEERLSLLDKEPQVDTFIKPIYGGQEFIKSIERYCLWIEDSKRVEAERVPFIAARISCVKGSRSRSDREATRKLAAVPHRFAEVRHVATNKVIVPNLSTDRREWFAVGFLGPDDVVIAPSLAVNNAELWELSLLSSKLHMVWIKAVCGRFKTDIRYSNTLGWNTFPVPPLSSEQKNAMSASAERILLARDQYFEKTISELYDPNRMDIEFPELNDAHHRNDLIVEQAYRAECFSSDEDRLDYLFALYRRILNQGGNDGIH